MICSEIVCSTKQAFFCMKGKPGCGAAVCPKGMQEFGPEVNHEGINILRVEAGFLVHGKGRRSCGSSTCNAHDKFAPVCRPWLPHHLRNLPSDAEMRQTTAALMEGLTKDAGFRDGSCVPSPAPAQIGPIVERGLTSEPVREEMNWEWRGCGSIVNWEEEEEGGGGVTIPLPATIWGSFLTSPKERNNPL